MQSEAQNISINTLNQGAQSVNGVHQENGADPARSPNPGNVVIARDSDGTQSQGPGPGQQGPGRGRGTRQMVDASHLLRFQYQDPARQAGGGGRGGARGVGVGRRYNNGPTRPQKYDRNKFLQANYRFLVSDAVDADSYHSDADRMLSWEDVLQVELLAPGPVQCPISLDAPPLCPQITPCGHIFSFPSIMQHLVHHGGDHLRRAAPCPLCFAPLVARELRLALITPVTPIKAGSSATFQLLKRGRTTILPQCAGMPAPGAPAAGTPTGLAAGAAPSPAADRNSSKAPRQVSGSGAGQGAIAGAAAGSSEGAGQGHTHPLRVNRYAKFATADSAEAMGLWAGAATELAAYAAELTAEGGLDAAQVAPFIYASLDVLALRARRWATHRAECLAARAAGVSVGGLSVGGPDPDVEGAVAEAAVKQLFMAATGEVAAAAARAAQQAKLDASFPSLAAQAGGGAPPAGMPATTSYTGSGAGAAAQQAAAAARQPVPAAAVPTVPATTSGTPKTPAATPATATTLAAAAPDGPAPEVSTSSAHCTPVAPAAGDSIIGEVCGGGGGGAAVGSDDAGVTSSSADAALLELGSSAAALTKVNAATTAGDFFCYQSVDGQWVFMDPLNVRVLLAHYGSYDACPSTIVARVVELEAVEQSEATRRRWRFLSHLPLTGQFSLAEVSLEGVVPPEALAPFAAELGAREKRRKARERDERRTAARERAAARAAADARRGPTAEELRAMPALGAGSTADVAAAVLAAGPRPTRADAEAAAAARALGFVSGEDLAESLALQASLDEATAAGVRLAASPPSGGVSFARMTKMGFAATGPALGSSPPLGGGMGTSPPGQPIVPVVQGAWAAKKAGPAASTLITGFGSGTAAAGGAWGTAGSSGASTSTAGAAAAAGNPASTAGGGKKGGNKKGTLLFSTAQRRY